MHTQNNKGWAALFAAVWAAAVLTACGGGGGGSGGGGGGSSPPVTSPPPYTLTPSTAKASYVAGYPDPISMTAKQTVTFTGLAYIQIVADAAVFQSPITITANGDGTFTVVATPSASLASGHYTGNLTVSVCQDPNCATHLAGSPFKVPYDIETLPPEGSLTKSNLSKLAPLAGAPDWATFQGNASHTGYVPVTLSAAAFNVRWKWSAPAYGGKQWSPSTIATGGGNFYVVSGRRWIDNNSKHELFAYKEDDGSKVWMHSFDDLTYASTNPVAYDNGKIYIAAGQQQSTYMFAFDAATGQQSFRSAMSSQWENYLAPTVFNGTVYTDAGTYGGMYAFNATSGTQKFFAGVSQYDGWTPAVDATGAYAYAAGKLFVMDNQTGQTQFTISDPNYDWNGYTVNSSPILGAPNSVFSLYLGMGFQTDSIAAYDTQNKSVRWTAKGRYAGNPAYADGLLFVGNSNPFQLQVLNESDGTLAWKWTPPGDSAQFVGSVLVTKNLVFVSTNAAIFAIDRATHAQVWTYAASGQLAISANGLLYIIEDHKITAINLQ